MLKLPGGCRKIMERKNRQAHSAPHHEASPAHARTDGAKKKLTRPASQKGVVPGALAASRVLGSQPLF